MSDLFMRSRSIPNSDIVVCTLAECMYLCREKVFPKDASKMYL